MHTSCFFTYSGTYLPGSCADQISVNTRVHLSTCMGPSNCTITDHAITTSHAQIIRHTCQLNIISRSTMVRDPQQSTHPIQSHFTCRLDPGPPRNPKGGKFVTQAQFMVGQRRRTCWQHIILSKLPGRSKIITLILVFVDETRLKG